MNFHIFNSEFFKQICFSSSQVYAWQPKFNKNNLTNWVKKGYLIKLKNGFYSFPEYLSKPNFNFYIANRIYRPSYISTHAALAFYGLIPESVVQVTSVSTLKTINLKNDFGSFIYQTINPKLMFGYEQKPLQNDLSLLIASPEKAILDLLYLNPYYNSIEDLKNLRFDSDIFSEAVNSEAFLMYSKQFKNVRLSKLIDLLLSSMNA